MTRATLLGAAGLRVAPLDHTFEPGVVTLLVGPDDGAEEVAAWVSGAVRPRKGLVRVDGRDPYQSPDLRRRCATLLAVEDPLEGDTVADAVTRSLELRGGGRASAVLDAAGVGALGARSAGHLSKEERRTVALALALSTEEPQVVSLFEPFTTGVARNVVLSALSRFRAGGALVLSFAASRADARDLGGHVLRLRRAHRRSHLVEEPAFSGGARMELVVRTPRVQSLAAALATEPDVQVEGDGAHYPSDSLVVRGSNLELLSLAVLRAAHQHAIVVSGIEPGQMLPAERKPRRFWFGWRS